MFKKYWVFLFLILPAACLGTNQALIKETSSLPLLIDSDGGMHCQREKNSCVATKNVVAMKGIYKLYCDILTTHLRKNKQGKEEIWKVEAQGNVRLTGPPGEQGFGQYALYDMDRQVILLTNPVTEKKAVMIKDENLIRSDKVTIYLRDVNGKQELKQVIATDNVTVSSPIEIGYSDIAIYNPDAQKIYMRDNVKIVRQEGQIEGVYGEVNLDNQTSKMLRVDPQTRKSTERVQVFIKSNEVKRRNQVQP